MKRRFEVGARVHVQSRDQPRHVRTPYYIRGKTGVVLAVCGTLPNPELLAEGEMGVPYRRLYRVIFEQPDLWPAYTGGDRDTLVVDIFEHWLSAA